MWDREGPEIVQEGGGGGAASQHKSSTPIFLLRSKVEPKLADSFNHNTISKIVSLEVFIQKMTKFSMLIYVAEINQKFKEKQCS